MFNSRGVFCFLLMYRPSIPVSVKITETASEFSLASLPVVNQLRAGCSERRSAIHVQSIDGPLSSDGSRPRSNNPLQFELRHRRRLSATEQTKHHNSVPIAEPHCCIHGSFDAIFPSIAR